MPGVDGDPATKNLAAQRQDSRPSTAEMPSLRKLLLAAFCGGVLFSFTPPCAAGWTAHVVEQLNGKAARLKLPADRQIVTEQMNEITGVPYIVYMPEKDQVLMTYAFGASSQAALMSSSDRGATWSKTRFMRPDEQGRGTLGFQTGLSYLGAGRVITGRGYLSADYGETWPELRAVPAGWKDKPSYSWDPLWVERDPHTGAVTRMTAADWRRMDAAQEYSSSAAVFFSTDEGRTWSEPQEIPEWKGVNEVTFVRAQNGTLIAACRTDNPDRFKTEIDHYCGLGTSVSKDDGRTWSTLNMLYEWGRHHPSLVLMPDGDIVLSYVVRLGYNHAADGYPQFGIEAVVSHDHGESWDLDHRYILSSWKGNRAGPNEWWASSQATSTVLLPDGALLTAFGTGYRGVLEPSGTQASPRDVGLVKWRLNGKGLKTSHSLSDAPWNSDRRNRFELTPGSSRSAPRVGGRVNLAATTQGAKVTASETEKDPTLILWDPYLSPASLTLHTMPAWIEIGWPKAKRFNEVRIRAGEPAQRTLPSGECAPLEYRLQYDKAGEWVDLVPPVNRAAVDESARGADGGLVLTHTFATVRTAAIRWCIARSNDTGKRLSSPDTACVPPAKRAAVVRSIEILAP
jgi:hypothetical protein